MINNINKGKKNFNTNLSLLKITSEKLDTILITKSSEKSTLALKIISRVFCVVFQHYGFPDFFNFTVALSNFDCVVLANQLLSPSPFLVKYFICSFYPFHYRLLKF